MPENGQSKQEENSKTMSKKSMLLISLLILIASAGGVWVVFQTEPEAVRGGATKKTAMLVDVVPAERGDFAPIVEALGTVTPSRDIVLSPRVAGEVISIGEGFTPGGFVKKDDVLLQLDPADYRHTLSMRESELSRAIADLELERGNQAAARQEYRIFDERLPESKEALVLRKPQLDALQARVESARTAVKQARLDLWRTTVRAPFDAHVLARNVNVGSQVSPGANLGRLVGWHTYWVETSVPLSKISRLRFPSDNGDKGAPVRINNTSAWPEGSYREGRLFKLVGELEAKTRMARVLVEVNDPLGHEHANDRPMLMIGSYVTVRIEAETLKDVLRVARDHMRKNETVWVMTDEKLDIREVDIVFRDSRYVYVRDGLKEGDRIVTSNLASVVEGTPLRVKGEKDTPGKEEKNENGDGSSGREVR